MSSSMFRSFSVFNYRVWFIGALVSNVGQWMQGTALSWVVLTQLTDNDAGAMGITDAGIFGDILCARMAKRGVAGLVTDGVMRDAAGIDLFGEMGGDLTPGSPPIRAGST